MPPAQHLLELLQTESLALHGRDMPLLEDILAQKQAMIILLEQHGRKRSEILASLNLPTNRQGLEQLASHSSIGDQLLAQSDVLTDLLTQCQATNVNNGQSILVQQAATANQLKNPHRRRAASALRCPWFNLQTRKNHARSVRLEPFNEHALSRRETCWQNAGQ